MVEDERWVRRGEFDHQVQKGWRMTAGWEGVNLTAKRVGMTAGWVGVNLTAKRRGGGPLGGEWGG